MSKLEDIKQIAELNLPIEGGPEERRQMFLWLISRCERYEKFLKLLTDRAFLTDVLKADGMIAYAEEALYEDEE